MDSLTNEVVWGVVDGGGCGERGRGNVVRGGGVCGERLKSRRRLHVELWTLKLMR